VKRILFGSGYGNLNLRGPIPVANVSGAFSLRGPVIPVLLIDTTVEINERSGRVEGNLVIGMLVGVDQEFDMLPLPGAGIMVFLGPDDRFFAFREVAANTELKTVVQPANMKPRGKLRRPAGLVFLERPRVVACRGVIGSRKRFNPSIPKRRSHK